MSYVAVASKAPSNPLINSQIICYASQNLYHHICCFRKNHCQTVLLHICPAFNLHLHPSLRSICNAFRPTGSTTSALKSIEDHASALLNFNHYVILIGLDFSKVFATLRHSSFTLKLTALDLQISQIIRSV